MKTDIALSLDKNHWLEMRDYLRSLPEKPPVADLERVIYLARHHQFWIVREEAVKILAITGYDFRELLEIAATDKLNIVRMRAEKYVLG